MSGFVIFAEETGTFAEVGLRPWSGDMVCLLTLLLIGLITNGVLPALLGYILITCLVLLGGYRVISGGDLKTNLAVYYLWLTPPITLSILKSLSDALANWLAWAPLTVLQTASLFHLALVACAIWCWVTGCKKANTWHSDTLFGAGLLILGAVVFWVGARTFPGGGMVAIAGNPQGYFWTSLFFGLATLITLPGLGLFTLGLRTAGDRTWGLFGFFCFLFGAGFWLIHLAFRATVMLDLAAQFQEGLVPDWTISFRDWMGVLFGLFSVLAYLAIACYGAAILRTQMPHRRLGWFCLLAGLLATPLFGPPFFIHLFLWLVGMVTLNLAGDQSNPQPTPTSGPMTP